MNIPPCPQTVAELEAHLSEPDASVIEILARADSDIIFLGVGGKMGPTMARMARRARDAAGSRRRVIGVSRFGRGNLQEKLQEWGIETISCDLLDERAIANLPEVPLVMSMSGFKFGASQDPGYLWAMNCLVPALVCQKFRNSRIVAFSTGNVYGPVPIQNADGSPNLGSRETDELRADGEYAMTAIGRERIYEHFNRTLNIPIRLLRLNYATELRYGVLVDLAQDIAAGRPIDLSLPRVNVIWLADANRMALRAFANARVPLRVSNLAGEEILSLRETCEELGRLLNREVVYNGSPGSAALLNDGRGGYVILGRPQVPAAQMIKWTAEWVARGGECLGKPTHFQTTDGKF